MAPSELWYRHTLGGAKAMGVDQKIGNLAVGYEADFVVLDDQATALLSRRSREAASLEQWLFGLIVLGDDRAIARTYIAGHEASLN